MIKPVLCEMTVPSMDALHDYLAEVLSFPEYYGRNLDALYDCLTDIREEVEFKVFRSSLEHSLGDKAERVIRVLVDVAIESENLRVAMMDLRNEEPEENWEP